MDTVLVVVLRTWLSLQSKCVNDRRAQTSCFYGICTLPLHLVCSLEWRQREKPSFPFEQSVAWAHKDNTATRLVAMCAGCIRSCSPWISFVAYSLAWDRMREGFWLTLPDRSPESVP